MEEPLPAPPADTRDADQTNLPPTPAEVEAFEKDDRPGAYERQVERLLASNQFGVRWARPQGQKADVPRHVPVELARERITVKGPQIHDATGRLDADKA